MGNQGTHADAAVVTDADGTITSFLRGIVKLLSDGITVALSAVDVEIGAVELKNATDDTRAVVGAASGAGSSTVGVMVADGNLHDSLGAVGAAADADGVIHGQLRSIAENTDALPTALGSAADSASLPVTQSTEDKAVLATVAGDTTSLDAKEVEIDFTAAPTQVSLSASTARSSQLAVGRYVIKSDAPTFVRQGNSSSDATVTTDFKIEAGVCYVMYVSHTDNNGYLSGILSTGTGTLDIQATV